MNPDERTWGSANDPPKRSRDSTYDVLRRTPAGPYLVRSAIRLEHRLAILRIWAGLVVLVAGTLLTMLSRTPSLLPGATHVIVLTVFVLCAVGYLRWAPYKKDPGGLAARVMVVADTLVVLDVILSTGGLNSPYWAAPPVLLFIYIFRFPFGRVEAGITSLLAVAALAALQLYAPVPAGQFVILLFAFALIMVVTALASGLYVGQQRRDVEEAFRAEIRAVARIVNTVQHEVNNPLAVAAGNMDLLRRSAPAIAREERYLERIDSALDRIQAAVGRLRELGGDPAVVGEGMMERFEIWQSADVEAGEPPDQSTEKAH